MFNPLKKKSSSSKGINVPSTFIIGGLIGAVGAYFFLTENGKSARKKIVEKAGELQTLLGDRPGHQNEVNANSDSKEKTAQSSVGAASGVESTPPAKAQNMVNHLKKNNDIESTEKP